ncbi:MAG: KH domain-containing protein [bacterium]|nr:KH domain-containing protein [bacterium]
MLWREEKDASEQLAEELLKRLLQGMGIAAELEIRRREGNFILSIEGCGEAGRVIGRDGNTLYQLQYLLNLMLMKKLKSRMNVVVDVEGYRERRKDKLTAEAKEAATKVKRQGNPVTLEPMHAADRRTVHLALRDDPMIETSSINEDRETGMKSVRISLRKEAFRPQKTELPEGREEADLPEDREETEPFEAREETDLREKEGWA